MKNWLEGKKTYILAAVYGVVTILLVGFGELTPEAGTAVLLFGVSLFAVVFRAALEQHKAEVLQAVEEVAAAGVALRAGNRSSALQDAEAAVVDGVKVEGEVQADTKAVNAS